MKKTLISLAMGIVTLAIVFTSTALYANADEKAERRSVFTSTSVDQAKIGHKSLFREQMTRQLLRNSKSALVYRPFVEPKKAPLSIPQARVVGPTKIYGTVINSTSWGEDQYGIPVLNYGVYSITPSSEKSMTEVKLNYDMCANGGGFLIGDSYYVLKFYTITGEYYFTRLHEYDINTWEEISMVETEIEHVSNDMTYDPVTETVYGCFYNDDMSQCVWGTFDVATATRTIITPLSEPLKAVAANTQGEIYAIGSSGILYSVEKTTGALTTIGNTGVTPYYLGSAVFDHRSGKLYWFAYPEDNTAHLYEVNTETAALSEVCQPENYEEVCGAVILNPLAADGAPDFVNNLTSTFEGTATSGTVSFTMPTVTYAGESLSGELDYTLLINDVKYTSGKANAGADVTLDVTITNAPKRVEFTVYASNSAGDGVKTDIDRWVGVDLPVAPENLKLRKGEGDFDLNLTWDAPSATQNGGALAGDISYTIVRYPGAVTVATNQTATSFSETMTDNGDITKYYYEVTAYGGYYRGATATSNSVALGMTSVPYHEPFNTADALNTFTVINANEDDQTWEWYNGSTWYEKIQYVRCKYSLGMETPMDDWLITPGIKLEKGKLYEFAFNAQTQYYEHVERVSASFGKAPDVESMTTELVAPTDITKEEFGHKFAVKFHVPEDGVYYFGIHGISDPDKYFLGVDDIKVTEGPSTSSPATIEDLAAAANPNGELKATITFTAPSKNIEGNDLTSLTGVEIYRGEEKITTVTPAIGQAVSYVDETAQQGFNTYKVIPVNEMGAGFETTTTVFVGYDTPTAPVNPVATTSGDKVIISWGTPTVGVNGGYIDTESLTYDITTIKGAPVADDITELTFTDTPQLEQGQDLITYYVYANTSTGSSVGAATNRIIIGDPYTLPFKESFPNADPTYYPWTIEILGGGYYAAWYNNTVGYYPSAAAQDGDSGLVSFIANSPGADVRYISPSLTLGGVEQPTLEYYYYYLEGCQDDLMKVEVSVNGGSFEEVDCLDFNEETGTSGWRKRIVSLAKYKDEEAIRIALRGISQDPNSHYIHVDNIQIRNVIDYDLRLTAFEVPVRVQVGKENIIEVSIENIGGNVATGYTVDLYADDVLVNSVAGPNLQRDETAIVNIEFNPTIDSEEVTKLYAMVNYEEDLDLTNNRSTDQFAFIKMPDYPAVDDLTGEGIDGDVELNWSEPEPVSAADGINITDSMEDYESFIIENIGKWTLYDGNGIMTYGINNVVYPHAYEPAAFQIFNPNEVGLSAEYWDAHSGDQLIVSWAVGAETAEDAAAGNVPATDHWLISPILPGDAQTISFFVKSATDTYGLEGFSVYYSTTGVAKENFIKLDNSITKAPTTWTEVTADLPQGAKYFAIVHDSTDTFVLMVDDITYTSAAEEAEELGLVGYNVYRDGNKLTQEPIVENFYLDDVPDPTATYSYKVTVVYDKGESAYSNEVTVTPTSVGSLTSDNIQVTAGKGYIRIANANGVNSTIVASDGKTLYNASTHDVTVTVEPGVYAVTIGKQTIKVRAK